MRTTIGENARPSLNMNQHLLKLHTAEGMCKNLTT